MADAFQHAGRPRRASLLAIGLLAAALVVAVAGRADEPYARSRTYDLQNARLEMRFDLAERAVHGTATHTLAPLAAGLSRIEFDAVDLAIVGVRAGGNAARFEQSAGKLYVTLDQPAPAGQPLQVEIRYSARPRKGMTFILPDAHYPRRPAHIWTQGQSEEVRYWAPIYDYPNDLTASETIVTVPAHWETLSNGVLVSTTAAAGGMKTWHWRQSKPHATYLISVVAGEFEKAEETWRGIPLSYYVLRGEGARIPPTFSRTRKMLDFFSDYYGTDYPWEKYAQIAVEEHFGGMEHTSATTLTHSYMLHPDLAADALKGPDFLIAHELAHQWFGDLVTCKDWASLWINEGFATHAEILWDEHHFGADEAAFTLWDSRNAWLGNDTLFTVPLTTRDITDAFQHSGNTYGKAGWVVEMLRRELGEENFRKSLAHFLAAHRHQNVVSADLVRSIEQATGRNLDPFFDQWVHGAGAPRFDVRARWEPEQRRVVLTVKQTQKVEGAVRLFRVPVEVEITTAQGRASHLINVSKAEEVFTLPAPEQPQMVLFDKGGRLLRELAFAKSPAEWMFQLRNAADVPDRADAARALGEFKDNAEAARALGEAARWDSFWGVRREALRALARIDNAQAQAEILASFSERVAAVRQEAVELAGGFHTNARAAVEIERLYRDDKAWRVRAAALVALARLRSPHAFDLLREAAGTDSPDDRIRIAALRGLGTLGDDRGLPILLAWSALGRPLDARAAAIAGLGRVARNDRRLTEAVANFLHEPYIGVQFAAVAALGERGGDLALTALEGLATREGVNENVAGFAQVQAMRIRNQARGGN